MSFPTGWKLKCKITIDAAKVIDDLTDYPMLITSDMLPDELLTSGGPYQMQADGDDIRFTTDSAGTNEIPVDVVTVDLNATPANSKVEIWALLPSVSSVTDEEIYVWGANPSATKPLDGAVNGRDAVWDQYVGVWHLNGSTSDDVIDSSGNASNGSVVGTPTNLKGLFGDEVDGGAFEFDQLSSHEDGIEIPDYAASHIGDGGSATEINISLWCNGRNWPSAFNDRLFQKRRSALSGFNWRLTNDNTGSGSMVALADADTGTDVRLASTSLTNDQTYSFASIMRINGTSRISNQYKDGAFDDNDTQTMTIKAYDTEPLDIGGVNGRTTATFEGDIDEVRLREGTWTGFGGNSGRIESEYNNLSDPSNWASPSTAEILDNASNGFFMFF